MMKSIWAALFLVLLLLCGCAPQPEPEEVPPETVSALPTEVEPTEPVSLYEANHSLEEATGGALKIFPLKTGSAEGIRFLGKDILLFSGYGDTKLTLLTGLSCEIRSEVYLPCSVSSMDPAVTVDGQGITYVDSGKQELVFLNALLEETRRIPLPEGCETPALSSDRQFLYYCTNNALRILELDTGLDRLVREMSFSHQELTALHWDDTVLECSALDTDGNWHTLFVCTETGQLLHEAGESLTLWSEEDSYFAISMDGPYRQLISGSAHYGPSVLVPPNLSSGIQPVPQWEGIMLFESDDAGTKTILDYYDLCSGRHPYRLTLPGNFYPVSTQPDPQEAVLWFLCYNSETQQDLLCAWDLCRSAQDDPTCYLQDLYTQEKPDAAGLSDCAQLAAEISRKYGIRILLWSDITLCQPKDYDLLPEYQVPLIRQRLEELDQNLSIYPESMLYEAVTQNGGELSICLVRSILPKTGVSARNDVNGLQFWDPQGNAWVVITSDDQMAQHLHHELFHILDSRVLTSCDAYDRWNDLNPDGFEYDYDYLSNLQRNDLEYVSGTDAHFIDLYAMSFPGEDRARIMEYAMQPGQGYRFQSAPLQKKLRQLCLGLRKAFHLQEQETAYPWEQHLTKAVEE